MGRKTLFGFGLIGLLAVLAATSAIAAWAQGSLSFGSLEVDLWPEYDRPAMLVIYRITLSSDTSLPADVTLRVPQAAQVHAVAARQADGGLFNIAYDQALRGDWTEISFNAALPEIQFEYYDSSLIKDGARRTYKYSWPGDYAVESMNVEVQQPLGASNLTTSPALGSGVPGEGGLVYYRSSIGALNSGQGFDLQISYDKADEALSATGLQVQPSAPVDENASGWRNQFLTVLPWGLLALGLLLLVGGGVWYWQSGRRKSEASQPQRRRRKPAAAQETTAASESHVYCYACGKRAGPGDRFCRACGTRLRAE